MCGGSRSEMRLSELTQLLHAHRLAEVTHVCGSNWLIKRGHDGKVLLGMRSSIIHCHLVLKLLLHHSRTWLTYRLLLHLRQKR